MSDWKQISSEDAERIRSGGQWAYVEGRLTRISTAAMTEQLREMVPGVLDKLAERLAVESLEDMEDLDAQVADDFRSITFTMRANGHVATERVPLIVEVN